MELDPRTSAPQRVEAYLDQILAPLARRLSPFHREELRRELREHLWARVDAYRELGQSEEEAVTEALRQFGGAEDFLRQWRREWARTPHRLTLQDVYKAGIPALRSSLAGIAGAFLPLSVLHRCYLNLRGSAAGALLDGYGYTLGWAWIWFAFLLLPTLVGVRHGRRTPQRAGVGMLAALTAEFLVASLLYENAAWALPVGWPVRSYLEGDSSIMLGVMAAWIPIAGGAAAISGWWARRRQAA